MVERRWGDRSRSGIITMEGGCIRRKGGEWRRRIRD